MRSRSFRRDLLGVPAYVATFLIVALLAMACVSDGSGDDAREGEAVNPENEEAGEGEEEGDGVLATSLGTSTDGGTELVFEIYTLDRLPDDTLLLEFGLANHSEDSLHIYSGFSGLKQAMTANAVTLIDAENMTRHLPLELSDGTCFCRNWRGEQHVAPGDTLEAWVVYPAPPPDVETVTVEPVQAPPLMDLQIGEALAGPEPDGAVGEPEILELFSFSDDLGDGTGRSESGDETAIMLSTDVLFDVNESVLTDEAEHVLEETAAEIDAASGELVQIGGHADSTGTDAINDPLSLDRAEAVQERLEELVTGSGIEYEAEGHGSHEPIADNDTEEGREKNRRVTVTFTP